MAVSKLTDIQKERLKRLEPALKYAAESGDFNLAKTILIDLKGIYLSTGNSAKFSLAKNRLFEAYMEAGDLAHAIDGLEQIRKTSNNKTRVYLEATSLLAICYLRNNLIAKAEPLMKEVLTNDDVIKSSTKRQEFRKLIIERFDQEATLFALKSKESEEISLTEIESDASLLAQKYSEEEMYLNIGKVVPQNAKDILAKVDEFSKKQLPSAQRLMLPSPIKNTDDEKIGKTVFESIKRIVYKSICDKKGELYKYWQGNTITAIKSYITIAVAEAFTKLNIGIKAVLISVVAIIIKLGIQVYCEHNKPVNIMDIR